jgi:hypothetical protein
MTIARKPKKAEASVDVDALIAKGGSVAGQGADKTLKATAPKPSPVVVRIPAHMLAGIEQARQARAVQIPRHTWLLEAIVEKLARDV